METETDPVLGRVEASVRLDASYIEIPLLLKVGTGFGIGRFDVLLGPSFGYALNGKIKTTLSIAGQVETETRDLDFENDNYNRSDLGAQVGASLGINLGSSTRLFVDGRYLLGLSNVNSDENTSDQTIKNRGIALSGGLLFSF